LEIKIFFSTALLDDLDKELNNYIMRCKEWYGWHFPELSKIIQDNIAYCKAVKKIGKYLDSAIALSEWEKII
jgi:nucleolar protein 58